MVPPLQPVGPVIGAKNNVDIPPAQLSSYTPSGWTNTHVLLHTPTPFISVLATYLGELTLQRYPSSSHILNKEQVNLWS